MQPKIFESGEINETSFSYPHFWTLMAWFLILTNGPWIIHWKENKQRYENTHFLSKMINVDAWYTQCITDTNIDRNLMYRVLGYIDINSFYIHPYRSGWRHVGNVTTVYPMQYFWEPQSPWPLHRHLAPIHWADEHLTAISREVSKPCDSGLYFFNRSEIWQAHRQQGCRDACHFSKRYRHYNIQSRDFARFCGKTSYRLVILNDWNCNSEVTRKDKGKIDRRLTKTKLKPRACFLNVIQAVGHIGMWPNQSSNRMHVFAWNTRFVAHLKLGLLSLSYTSETYLKLKSRVISFAYN